MTAIPEVFHDGNPPPFISSSLSLASPGHFPPIFRFLFILIFLRRRLPLLHGRHEHTRLQHEPDSRLLLLHGACQHARLLPLWIHLRSSSSPRPPLPQYIHQESSPSSSSPRVALSSSLLPRQSCCLSPTSHSTFPSSWEARYSCSLLLPIFIPLLPPSSPSQVEPFSWYNLGGLVIVLGGFIFYSVFSPKIGLFKDAETRSPPVPSETDALVPAKDGNIQTPSEVTASL